MHRTVSPHDSLSARFGTPRKAGLSLLFALGMLLPSAACLARDIDWGSLNLTQQQETQINRLENTWEKTHAEVAAQIERDRAELKTILPTGNTQRIRTLQNRIMMNKMYLMNESMNTFLQKRETLTPTQRTQLHTQWDTKPAASE